ncbi:MAG: septum formation protein Maf [Dehalococcoidia bacterium]|nr:septum formation protein Maf [Dehalococcoidia bacterium]
MIVILASASPRRRALLAALLTRFEVHPADLPETMTGEPRADALRLATAKARLVAARYPTAVVVGSDTIVADDDREYGKPADAADALAMLTALQGRTHRVMTGVAVVAAGAARATLTEAMVTLASLDDAVIARYVASGRPLDKAGAYAIQEEDPQLVQRLDGCYCAVMGLPLWRLRSLLAGAGLSTMAPDATFPRCAGCPDREGNGSPAAGPRPNPVA